MNIDINEYKTAKEILDKIEIAYIDITRYVTGYCHKVYDEAKLNRLKKIYDNLYIQLSCS